MSCSNCYSGCVETNSDKCVRYTGIDITVLGIKNGDSLSYVNAAIIGFLVSTLDGSGIKYELDPSNLCDIVSNELPDCGDISVVDITNALSAAICALDTRVVTLEAFQTAIEGSYTPGCIPGISGSEGTHVVLQAVLDHLCTVAGDLDALELDVATNYVLIADINTYIENYLAGLGSSTAQKNKMVPYTVMEYYGTLSHFDATGAGTGDWAEIYLCNGNNNTPDKRGRIAVGTTSGMGGDAFPTATDPALPGNPTYSLYTSEGNNTVTLTSQQIPAHTHTNSVSSDGAHTHQLGTGYVTTDDDESGSNSEAVWHSGGTVHNRASEAYTLTNGTHTHTVTINSTGGGESHSNIPPVLACHYIMYIPTA
jgi:microcystin-dependent protein